MKGLNKTQKTSVVPSEEVKLFLAYSRNDKEILNRLKQSFKVFERAHLVDKIWYDELIEPGEDWDKKIKKSMEESDIIILLISDSFLASDYCDEEMRKAIYYHENGKKTVVPIIARHCMWNLSPIANIHLLPSNGRPLIAAEWGVEDESFYHVSEELTAILGKVKEKKRRDVKWFFFTEKMNRSQNYIHGKNWELGIKELEESISFFEAGFKPDRETIQKDILTYKNEIRFESLLKEGKELQEQNELKAAIIKFKEASQIKNDEDLVNLIASVTTEIEEIEIARAKNKYTIFLKKGDIYYKKRMWKKANEQYKSAFRLYNVKFGLPLQELKNKMIDVNNFICSESMKKVKKKFETITIGNEGDEKALYVTNWEFDSVEHIDEILLIASIEDKYGVLVNGCQLIVDFIYDEITIDENDQAIVKIDGKFGLVDLSSGLEILLCEYEYIGRLTEGLRLVKINNKSGFLDKNLKEQIPLIYDDAVEFSEGLAAVKKGGLWGFIDQNGKVIITFQFNKLIREKSGWLSIALDKLFPFQGNLKSINRYFKNGKLLVKEGEDKSYYIGKDGKKVDDEKQ